MSAIKGSSKGSGAPDGDGLERLRRRVYARKEPSNEGPRAPEEGNAWRPDVPEDWAPESDARLLRDYRPKESAISPFVRRILVASAVFCAGAVIVSAIVFFSGGNIISSRNVDISVVGPVSIAGGDPLEIEATIKNSNGVALESADILIEYPEGTRRAGDLSSELRRYREGLGTIPAGGTVVKKLQAVLFGEEGEEKSIKISVEYRVKGSNAVFHKEKLYAIVISSSPVVLTLSGLKEINSGQEFMLTADVTSNSSAVLKGLLMRAEYPFGFTFERATPDPTYGENIWSLGDLKPEAKRTVTIRGLLLGEDGEERTFHFAIGTASPADEKLLGTTFLSDAHTIAIRKPFVGVDLSIDGSSEKEYVAENGKRVRVEILWKNNLPTQVGNLAIKAKLSGSAYDRASVEAGQGFYRSLDNTIIWDQSLVPEFGTVNPGDSGRVDFSFVILPTTGGLGQLRNPEMGIVVDVGGSRLSESEVPEEIVSSVSKKIKVASDLGLGARVLYSVGPFVNSGPIPPKAEKETTYTVTWTITNSTNTLGNTRVSAKLPSYVRWQGVTSPPAEKLSYNPVGGEVIWDAGEVKVGTGFGGAPREVSFQISFVPSLSQIGTAPVLVTEATAEAEDRFTASPVRSDPKSALTTRISADPAYKGGDELVVK